jgi:sporulation protein YlmC with PRC-barrel domain
MIRLLLLALSLSFAAIAVQPASAEMRSSDTTTIVVPMDALPTYGSIVSAWYKQPVYDTAEKKVGTVSDMLFSSNGSINAIMLDVGGFLGLGKKHVAVPVDAISLTQKGKKSWLTINTTKEAVKNATGYKYDKKDGLWSPM